MSTELSTEYAPGKVLPVGTKLRVVEPADESVDWDAHYGRFMNVRPGDVFVLLRDDNAHGVPYRVKREDALESEYAWLRRTHVEIVQEDETTNVSDWEQDFNTLVTALEAEAERRSWCSDFKTFKEAVQEKLKVARVVPEPAEPEWQLGDVVFASQAYHRREDGWYYSNGDGTWGLHHYLPWEPGPGYRHIIKKGEVVTS